MEDQTDHFLLICSTCEGAEHAERLAEVLAQKLPPRFAIKTIDCMAGCARPTTVGFQAKGKAQYLFGDIEGSADLDALAAFAQLFEGSADGWTNATDRPAALFKKTLSRMPYMYAEVVQ